MSTITPTKPVLFADTRSDAERFDPALHRGHLDPSRVPGYAEMVQANDIDVADALAFRAANDGRTKEDIYAQIGASPTVLDVELAWLPISAPDGGMSSHVVRQLDQYVHQQGFRLATEEDLLSRGFAFPPTARRAEDGTIRRGPDVALYIRSGEVARKWQAFKIQEQDALANAQPDAYSKGEYIAPTFREADRHETVTVKH